MSLTLKGFMTNFNLKNERMTNTELQSKFYVINLFKPWTISKNFSPKNTPKIETYQ